MATFSQWYRSKSIRRVTWVCGPETVLVTEVLREHKRVMRGAGWRNVYPNMHGEDHVWEAVLSFPPSGGRLVFVREAEKLTRTGNIEVLLAEEGLAATVTVFVSSEPDFARVERDGKKVLVPHLAAIQASRNGQLIRCAAPAKDEEKVKLVVSWWAGAGANFAHELLARCGGSLERAWEACRKAEYAELKPVPGALEYVVPENAVRSFTDALVAGTRAEAAEAAAGMTRDETGQALGVLARKLSQLELLHEARTKGMDAREVAAKLKLDRYVQHALREHVPAYGPDRVRHCRKLLAEAESAWRSGADSGVAEALAALW